MGIIIFFGFMTLIYLIFFLIGAIVIFWKKNVFFNKKIYKDEETTLKIILGIESNMSSQDSSSKAKFLTYGQNIDQVINFEQSENQPLRTTLIMDKTGHILYGTFHFKNGVILYFNKKFNYTINFKEI